MNEPLKLKLFSVYGQLLNRKILLEAWKRVRKNKGCEGVDKVTIKSFEENLENNLDEILKELKEKTYKPTPVRRVYIPKKNGKKRPLGIPTIKDRIVQQALVMRLEPFFEENVFHDNSCGFRPDRSAELALKKIVCRLEYGYVYIYDFDIKGYFDNIPHKKLMKVLNKYIADGTVLDMIWKWLKAGYMEDEIRFEQTKGTQQGGVISPLLANIYLNELDWELSKAGIENIRYADDNLVMCKSKDELEKAKVLVKKVLDELGLELAEDKTNDVDFHKDDFDYLGFTFHHLTISKKGKPYYLVGPSEKSLKRFKSDIKARTKKSCTFSFEKWKEILNPILRGKYNYFLCANKAVMEVRKELNKRNRICIAYAYKGFDRLDGYVRQRLRVSFANRGRYSARYNSGKMLNVKYGNEFFLRTMKLVNGKFLMYKVVYENLTIDSFIENGLHKSTSNKNKKVDSNYMKLALAK